jgi:hypothetical protein
MAPNIVAELFYDIKMEAGQRNPINRLLLQTLLDKLGLINI